LDGESGLQALATEQFLKDLPKVRPPTCLLADFITDRDPVTIIETSSK
jgi:hypothetical protein